MNAFLKIIYGVATGGIFFFMSLVTDEASAGLKV